MADPNDSKVGVLADIEGAEREGVRMGEALRRGVVQGFGPGSLAGSLLGNGMAPQAGGGGGGDSKSVTSLLEKILVSLNLGFMRMLDSAGYQQGFGGGVGGGGGAGPPAPPAEEAPSKQRGGGGGFNTRGVLGAANMFPQQAYANMYAGGFYSTDVAQFAASATSSIPVIGQFVGLVANTMKERDESLMSSIGVFRGGGVKSWEQFHDIMTDKYQGIDVLKQYGLDRGEAANLVLKQAQIGMSGQQGAFRALAAMQGLYGLGMQSGDFAGTLMRGGASGGSSSKDAGPGTMGLFAQALAVAIGTNLDRGRWGEAFSALSKAAGRIQTGDVSTSGLFQTMNLVGSMGARFQGDTAASGSMVGMLQGMQAGEGGQYANIAALRAAGLGQPGVSFTDAWMKTQIGAAQGGVDLGQVLRQYEKMPLVQQYIRSGTDATLNRAVFVLSKLLPAYKATDIAALLRTMRTDAYKGMTGRPGADGKIHDFQGQDPGTLRGMRRALEQGHLPPKEAELMKERVKVSTEWSEAAIGESRDFESYDLPENMDEIKRRNWMGHGAPVVPVDHAVGSTGKYIEPGSSAESMTADDFMEAHVPKGGRYGIGRKDTPYHPGVDITPTAPGDPIYCPCNGKILRTAVGATADQGAPGFGIIIKEDAKEGGRVFRIFHIDPDSVDRKSLRSGKRVARGQKLGKFFGPKSKAKGFPKGMAIHTHVTVQGSDPMNEDYPTKGTMPPEEQFDLEDILRPAVAPPPPAAPSSGSGADAAAAGAKSGATSMNTSRGGVDLNIYVFDGRISVQRAAANQKKPYSRQGGAKVG